MSISLLEMMGNDPMIQPDVYHISLKKKTKTG